MAKRSIQLDDRILSYVKKYQRKLNSADIPVSKMFIFGSYAKKQSSGESDIDLAIVSPRFGKDYHKEMVGLLSLRGDKLLDIEPHPFHPDDFEDKWNSLAQEVKKYGVKV